MCSNCMTSNYVSLIVYRTCSSFNNAWLMNAGFYTFLSHALLFNSYRFFLQTHIYKNKQAYRCFRLFLLSAASHYDLTWLLFILWLLNRETVRPPAAGLCTSSIIYSCSRSENLRSVCSLSTSCSFSGSSLLTRGSTCGESQSQPGCSEVSKSECKIS